MNCIEMTRLRQCAPLVPRVAPPSALTAAVRQTPRAPGSQPHTESDGPAGLVALATAFTDIDLRGTYTVREVAGILQLTTDKT